MPKWYYYSVYGLRLRSEFELPELRELSPDDTGVVQEFDVTLRLGDVPEFLPGGTKITFYAEYSGTRALISIDDITRILLEDRKDVTVQVLDNSNLSDARSFVLGSALGLLLHQRNELPLHVAALDTSEGAIAITGPSGAGKSTSAINLHRLTSWPIICDDVAVANLVDGRIELVSGVNRLKIWRDAVESLGIDSTTLIRDVIRVEKFHLFGSNLFSERGKNLRAIIVIKDAETFDSRRLVGGEKFSAVMNTVYRPEFARVFWEQSLLIKKCATIANSVSVVEVSRNKSVMSALQTASLLYDAVQEAIR